MKACIALLALSCVVLVSCTWGDEQTISDVRDSEARYVEHLQKISSEISEYQKIAVEADAKYAKEALARLSKYVKEHEHHWTGYEVIDVNGVRSLMPKSDKE